ncbi:MAG: DUF3783 domain-containing protein [Erysipelotrichaceae bacterium]|nr:DUF3783 domain-containing protein [Erysipelotrichaceae bacterium]
MNETILYYHLDLSTKEHIIEIASQLDIKVREIFDNQVNETMGYLLHLDGYESSSEIKIPDRLDQSFLFFAFMSDKQLDLLLEIFKVKEIPYIPYKAMLTENNVVYPFYQLYRNVENEYKQISGH